LKSVKEIYIFSQGCHLECKGWAVRYNFGKMPPLQSLDQFGSVVSEEKKVYYNRCQVMAKAHLAIGQAS
jgi:hypothetical protein